MSSEKDKSPAETTVPAVYFHRPGPANSRRTLEIAAKRADELEVDSIVISTTSGETGLMAARMFSLKNVVVVTHSTGFAKPDHQQLKPGLREAIAAAGAKILTCQHAFGGVGRAVRKKLGTYELEEIVAYTLRNFGEGTKVAIECTLMAADAGLVKTSESCIAVGGTAEGVDTALLIKPAHAQNFFDLRVLEVLAKPRLFP